jgi:hypothetical protein
VPLITRKGGSREPVKLILSGRDDQQGSDLQSLSCPAAASACQALQRAAALTDLNLR